MRTTVRALAAVIAGMFVAFVLVVAVELFSGVVHPLPADFGGTKVEMCRHVELYPQWVLAVVVPMWAAIGFVGTWTARRIGGFLPSAIVGFLLLSGLTFNVSMLPYPIWFKIATLVVIPITLVCGGRFSQSNKNAAAADGK